MEQGGGMKGGGQMGAGGDWEDEKRDKVVNIIGGGSGQLSDTGIDEWMVALA